MAFGSEQWMYNAGGGFYLHEIDNSVRLDSGALYTRTPSSGGNQKTWTYSAWVKNWGVTSGGFLLSSGASGNREFLIYFDSTSQKLNVYQYSSGAVRAYLTTSASFRDPSAWYHFVVAVDTTQAAASDRVKIYVNGEQQTDFAAASYPAQNLDTLVSSTDTHDIGRNAYNQNSLSDFYIAEVNYINGSALAPTSFGATKSGVWIPKRYSGTYGTNGFHLDFGNSGSLGADVSGNGNNWTPTNLATTDQMLDSPTNNFCTLNPLAHDGTTTTALSVSEGNLKSTHSVTGQWQAMHGTVPVSSGKWYYEVQIVNRPTNNTQSYNIGFYDAKKFNEWYYGLSGNLTYGPFNGVGKVYVDTTQTTYGTLAASDGDIYMFALDLENDKFWVGLNGTWMASGNPSTGANPSASGFATENGVARTWVTHQSDYAYGAPNGVFIHNCGQDSSFAGTKTRQGNTDANGIGDFYYAPPADYLALCSANLPETAIDPAEDDIPADYFNPVTYTGNGTSIAVDTGFQPDLVWVKRRDSAATNHEAYDSNRGVQKYLLPDTTNAEGTISGVTSFNSNGFTYGSNSGGNNNGSAIVSWNWKAGGAAVANTDGTIASQVSANTKSGFSIVTYTGNGSNASVGHGLSAEPELMIFKNRTSSGNSWVVYSSEIGASQYLLLNGAGASGTYNHFQNTAPTSSVAYITGGATAVNASTNNYVCYAFHSVEGFSKIGTYTGNGSADGPFVYTGFRPAFVLVKNASAAEWWTLIDNKRVGYNETNSILSPNDSAAEYAAGGGGFDLTSNGFKVRGTSSNFNGSGNTILYMAFAEMPYKYANAR